jgi:hypothetical protein
MSASPAGLSIADIKRHKQPFTFLPLHLIFERFLAKSINNMEQTHERMTPDHCGANFTHNLTNFLAHGEIITMHRAFTTGCFPLLERTVDEPFPAVIMQLLTLTTDPFTPMMFPAVQTDHNSDRLSLPRHSIRKKGAHGLHFNLCRLWIVLLY